MSYFEWRRFLWQVKHDVKVYMKDPEYQGGILSYVPCEYHELFFKLVVNLFILSREPKPINKNTVFEQSKLALNKLIKFGVQRIKFRVPEVVKMI